MFTYDGGGVIIFPSADLALVLLASPLLTWSFLLLQFLSLSLFDTFPKYTASCQKAADLLVWSGGLCPITFLGWTHRGVTGQVISLILVGLGWVCHCLDPSLRREPRPV